MRARYSIQFTPVGFFVIDREEGRDPVAPFGLGADEYRRAVQKRDEMNDYIRASREAARAALEATNVQIPLAALGEADTLETEVPGRVPTRTGASASAVGLSERGEAPPGRRSPPRSGSPRSSCPSCGSREEPRSVIRCAEQIEFFVCPCGFSTWDLREFGSSRSTTSEVIIAARPREESDRS